MEKQKIGVKMNLPYKEAITHLEDLLNGLKSGTIVVQSGDDSLTMNPGENVAMEVEAKVKKGKQKFSLEISWAEGTSGDLKISDKAPSAEEPKQEKEDNPAVTTPAQPQKAEPTKKAAAKKPVKPKATVKKTPAKKAATKAPAKPKP